MAHDTQIVAVATTACAATDDYTPQIAVQPGAAGRLCYGCLWHRTADDACPPALRDHCCPHDVVKMPVVTLIDADAGEDD